MVTVVNITSTASVFSGPALTATETVLAVVEVGVLGVVVVVVVVGLLPPQLARRAARPRITANRMERLTLGKEIMFFEIIAQPLQRH
jgi:hypothetical protein